jgi:hypothetical protein
MWGRHAARPGYAVTGKKTPRLTLGLKFRSDENISKWPPALLSKPKFGFRSTLTGCCRFGVYGLPVYVKLLAYG